MKRKTGLLLLVLTIVSFGAFAQYPTNHDFMIKRQYIGKSGMIAYTSWSGANLAAGIYCWAGTKGEAKYFGQMNVIWSTINLGIAIPGLIGSFKRVPKIPLPEK